MPAKLTGVPRGADIYQKLKTMDNGADFSSMDKTAETRRRKLDMNEKQAQNT